MKLDLGSGPWPKDGFRGVDKKLGVTDFMVDFSLGEPWPFVDDSVDELYSSHCIEHIDAVERPVWERAAMGDSVIWKRTGRMKDTLFHFFDEAFRIIKPGGTFEVRWPNPQSSNASGDPTHRRFISAKIIGYLNREARRAMGVGFYEVTCNWSGTVSEMVASGHDAPDETELHRRLEHHWNESDELRMILRADK